MGVCNGDRRRAFASTLHNISIRRSGCFQAVRIGDLRDVREVKREVLKEEQGNRKQTNKQTGKDKKRWKEKKDGQTGG